MILNHHRLCQLQNHPHLPLNLIELCQSTQQIGAFQVRVRQTLAQVLFTSLQQFRFWHHWANWGLQVLEQWVETPPSICQTPGLLPLQETEGVWSWREGVVIQAMALEAAHQLVESLPAEALESEALEQLLGLQDALVEDSSTIDPRGFQRIALGLPLIPNAAGDITTQLTILDPTIGRLPTLSFNICPQSAIAISTVQILGRWVWEVTQQFGVEVSYVGLRLMEQMAGRPNTWQNGMELQGTQMLAGVGETGQESKLKTLARRIELLCQSRMNWEERQLSQPQVKRWQDRVWGLESMEHTQGLELTAIAEGPHYEAGQVREITVRLRPGQWCERLVELYGDEEIRAIRGMGQMARQMLAIDPATQGMAARAAIFLGFRAWTGQSLALTVGDLLKAVETEERLRAIARNAIRREGLLQSWTGMWKLFHGMGWVSPINPLQGMEPGAAAEMGWLDRPLSLRIQATGIGVQRWKPLGDEGTMLTQGTGETGVGAMPMAKISSASLERALAVRGMSQAMLARSLKLDRSTINRWINGSRPIHPRYQPLLWDVLGTALQGE